MDTSLVPQSEDAKIAKRFRIRDILIQVLPVAALAVLFGVYCLLLQINGYDYAINLKTLLDESVVLVIVATGAIFIFSTGSFDISLGANLLLSSCVGILVYKNSGSIALMFLTTCGISVACALLSSVIASFFHIPMFTTTIAMLSVLSAIAELLINTFGSSTGGSSVVISLARAERNALKSLNTWWFLLAVLAVFMIFVVFLFNFTKLGRKMKFLGGSPSASKFSGVNAGLVSILGFVVAGLGVGIGASLTIIQSPTISTSTGSSYGMAVFIAIVFGGMPIAGGARSRVYSALIGGFSYILLKDILALLFAGLSGGMRDGLTQILSAILFLALVFVAGYNYRSKRLPR